MRAITRALSLILLLLGQPAFGADPIFSQEKESTLEKILRPLPDFEPFEKPAGTPLFFPDDVDRRVRDVLADSLTGRGDALEGHLRFLKNRDDELKRRGASTGLTDHVTDLLNSTIGDRGRYLKEQRKALSTVSSREQKNIIESRLRQDELSHADELQRRSTANQWAAVLNRMLSSIDLASVASGSYIGAAVDSTLSQVFALGSTEMPVEERRALALYLEHLRRYPDDPGNSGIKKKVDKLEKKKRDVLVTKQIEKAEEETAKGELARAEFYYAIAAAIDPLNPRVKAGSERLAKRIELRETAMKKGLSVTAASSSTGKPEDRETRDLGDLIEALSLRDAEQIEAKAKEVAERYRGKPLGESAKDASAVGLEIGGRHEEAKRVLQQIARSSAAPDEKRRAELLLNSPDYNLLASFHEAQSQRRIETVKYVLMGNDFLRKNLLYSAGPLAAAGPAGAASIGAANVILIGTNLFQALTSNPVSHESIIEKGVAYVRSHPYSESSSEVYGVLANAYEEAGMYDKAIAYHEMSGASSEQKIADLKERAAKQLLQAADKATGRTAKETYLAAILDFYPEGEIAEEATRKLAQLARIENQGLKISKKFLAEHPELYGPEGLRLKPTLLDGKIGNMELADSGINLLGEGEILLHLQTPWGLQRQTYPVEKAAMENFAAALRRKNHLIALDDVGSRPKGSVGGLKDLPPALLKQKPSGGGTEPDNADFRLVREATGRPPAYSSILDHELLTENEKDPSNRFKNMPAIHGSISSSGVDMSGSLPAGLWGNHLRLGADARSPFAGVELPVPLLQGFIPVDFIFQGRPGGLSVFPKIHFSKDKGDDQELYR